MDSVPTATGLNIGLASPLVRLTETGLFGSFRPFSLCISKPTPSIVGYGTVASSHCLSGSLLVVQSFITSLLSSHSPNSMPRPPAPGESTVRLPSTDGSPRAPRHRLELMVGWFVRFSLATVAGGRFRDLDETAAIGPVVTRRLRGVKQGRQAQTRPMQHSTIVQRRISD